MARVRSPQPLARIFAEDAQLAGWQTRRVREEHLTGIVRQHLPRQLGDRVRVSPAGRGQLEFTVHAGAVAAALRQRLPELLGALERSGVACDGVRIRVRVRESAPATPKAPPRRLDKSQCAPLTALARTLPPGPLQAAVRRLLRRAG